MDNERGCGLGWEGKGGITGSLMETLRGCREHARSGHMLTRPPGPQPNPGRGGNWGLGSAQRSSQDPSVCLKPHIKYYSWKKRRETLKVMWNIY